MASPRVMYATIREAVCDYGGDIEFHIECRFEDGQKWSPITVSGERADLADLICATLNAEAERRV